MLYIFDLDGTLYRGVEACPHAVDVVEELRRRGHQIRFLTNNSSKTQADQARKLTAMGIQCSAEDVMTSAVGAARFLQQNGLSSALVVGEPGLCATLEDAGILVSEDGEAVVAGVCRTLTYDRIDVALQRLLLGAEFIATNTDATYPLERGRLQPGAGATVGALTGCSQRNPIVIGKPNPYLVNLILEQAKQSADDAVVVGDRYETDIEAGLAAGCKVHLVLTGVTKTPVSGVPWSEDLRRLLL